MHSLSIFGTSSDAGKSTLCMALTRILHDEGYRVAPFKAQNVSNNARIADDGGEIAQAQYFAAEAIGLPTRHEMNPILLKSGSRGRASLIVNGRSSEEQSVGDYFASIERRKPVVRAAFERLQKEFEIIVAEGAGSPVELNLMNEDLSNLYIAQTFGTKIILVADIERGGVFASIWGVYNLLPDELKSNVIGVIVNKFRGDMQFFEEGVAIIEERFGLKVLGVVPYLPLNLGFEDIQSLENYRHESGADALNIAVVKFPHLSNFTDFEPLINDPSVHLHFITNPNQARNADLLILPGTRRTVDDFHWLQQQGFVPLIKAWEKPLFGLCGGYEMLFERLIDSGGIERQGTFEGLGRIEGDIVFEKEKTQRQCSTELFGFAVSGYEIHHGKSSEHPVGYQKENLYGTFLHGIFDNDNWRNAFFSAIRPDYRAFDFKRFKQERIQAFTAEIRNNLDIPHLVTALSPL
jgi:adenosylcobyric acid synthase